jgi:flagellar biogenesis protein FliO
MLKLVTESAKTSKRMLSKGLLVALVLTLGLSILFLGWGLLILSQASNPSINRQAGLSFFYPGDINSQTVAQETGFGMISFGAGLIIILAFIGLRFYGLSRNKLR